jgi:hypothetical protein
MIANPSAMSVGLAETVADTCAHYLDPVPLMRVGHVVAACERMVVTRPQVIIVMAGIENIDTLRERAEDIRAEIAELTADMNELQIKAAVINAKFRADKRW